MILQTTGGFVAPATSEGMFPLGPWCAEHDARPLHSALDLSSHTDLDVDSTTTSIINELEQVLYPALNNLHGVDLDPEVWRFSLGTYLRVLVPLVVTRWNLIRRVQLQTTVDKFTQFELSADEVIPRDRTEIQVLVNSHIWNQYLLATFCRQLGWQPVELPLDGRFERRPVFAQLANSNHQGRSIKSVFKSFCNFIVRQRPVIVSQTLLPFSLECRLALRHGSLPFFWKGDETYSRDYDVQARSHLVAQLRNDAHELSTILEFLVNTLPKLYVEDFVRIRQLTMRKLPVRPRVVFTSNLHMASDQFLLWLAEMKLSGTKVVIGQHGGVHCLAGNRPVEAVVESELADRYLAWGNFADHSTHGVHSPILATTNLKLGNSVKGVRKMGVVVMLDSPYRYPSSPRGLNGDRFDYATFLDELVGNLDLGPDVPLILRAYSGGERFDEPFLTLLAHKDRIKVDAGTDPIHTLYQRAQLVITTSIGTTLFQTLHLGVPTIVLLDTRLSPLSTWAEGCFRKLADSAIYFTDPQTLGRHVRNNFANLDAWWESPSTRQARQEFLETFSDSENDLYSFYSNQLDFSSIK